MGGTPPPSPMSHVHISGQYLFKKCHFLKHNQLHILKANSNSWNYERIGIFYFITAKSTRISNSHVRTFCHKTVKNFLWTPIWHPIVIWGLYMQLQAYIWYMVKHYKSGMCRVVQPHIICSYTLMVLYCSLWLPFIRRQKGCRKWSCWSDNNERSFLSQIWYNINFQLHIWWLLWLTP